MRQSLKLKAVQRKILILRFSVFIYLLWYHSYFCDYYKNNAHYILEHHYIH